MCFISEMMPLTFAFEPVRAHAKRRFKAKSGGEWGRDMGPQRSVIVHLDLVNAFSDLPSRPQFFP